ncbi:MAG: DJ-1/PfpI family protein [Deferribacteraceae bacterium]|nr:DJ-1/PfpI family protein [Deferribacteraceae bacterium]
MHLLLLYAILSDIQMEAEMANALLILADGFEEVEAITPIDLLRRAGVDVTVAALKGMEAIGGHSIVVSADVELKSVLNKHFDMLILPGGGGGTAKLAASEEVLNLLRKYEKEDRYIAAICAAPTVLAKAGVAKDIPVTSHPCGEGAFAPELYTKERVVVSGKVITSRSAGTAMDFSLELVKVLAGVEAYKTLKNDLLI